MSAKFRLLIGTLLVFSIAPAILTGQTYQPDDPVPPGSVFRIIDLESRIIDLESRILDLQFRVEAAPDVVPKPPNGQGARPGIASGPHSTMSSDFLYLPANPDAAATLTIRVADPQGQPLAGKRVQVTSTVSGAPADTIIQPDAPTDARGIATARVRPTIPPHTARFAARVLDDNVDIGQVVEIEVREPSPPSLLSPAFAPYFGGLTVSPPALVVGQPAIITVPLTNSRQVPVEARVRFFATVLNIGLGKWPQIGETETFVLQPGESRDVKTTWTPTVEAGHLCFKVEIWGRELPARASAWGGMVSHAYAAPNARAQAAAAPTPLQTQQHNWGPVALPPCGKPEFGADGVPTHASACVPSEVEKLYCEIQVSRLRKQIDELVEEMGQPGYDSEELQILTQWIHDLNELYVRFNKCAKDPPDPRYKELAAAASDTPAGHLDALTISMERYQGAEAAGDREWMARHLTARRLYLQRHAEALRRAGDAMQKRAEGLPPKEIPPAKSLRALLLETATLYRASADEAEKVARPSASTGVEGKAGAPVSQTYLVGNPHDRAETVDLFIRRASVPPEWKLSIVDAEKTPDGKPQKHVQEVEAGRHYRVQLPANGQLTVASVVIPVGVVGENTMARWADEGKIGDELIGGLVHELYVPGHVPDLQLPPVGSADTPASVPASATGAGQFTGRWWLMAAAGTALFLVLLLVMIYRSRRKA